MRRRAALQSLIGAPVVGTAVARAQAPVTQSGTGTSEDQPKLDLTAPDAVGTATRKFFTAVQYQTLEGLCDLIAPAYNGRPSARDAEAAEFLDFLLSESPAARQTLYRGGLDQLDASARAKYAKPFAKLTAAEAGALLAPLQAKWTWKEPTAVLPQFLRAAKNDILRATANSRAMAQAMSGGRRGAAGVNTYWEVID